MPDSIQVSSGLDTETVTCEGRFVNLVIVTGWETEFFFNDLLLICTFPEV